ncbi:dermonecrotic toxin domain-containing protein [Pseudomonas trivialis]|uniref:Dermonecrotic toxin N-terminal domain-containing protein n=1 Tax=Pseudomonas trivialis TaxID=200450 RepID=A0A0R2ZDX9_9PSED|nr:DUF6543 domain-containing protein [Pseudomonas trivialis]KRP58365.1 hypothetical protein TU79_20820 [Pseudomonas trivialis]SDS24235.1 hypothetical protein SAMN04490205_1907 [Pseudomonas trivialis]
MTQQTPTPTAQASPLTPHLDFIKAQVPIWLSQAPAQLRQDFRNSLISSNQARHDLNELLGTLQSPEAFARELLREKIRAWFFGLVTNEDAILCREWKNHHLLGLIKNHAKTTRQTLLEAALQNFAASEAEVGGMEIGTAIFNSTASGEVPTLVYATTFARFCRELDIGGRYLKHISNILEPDPADKVRKIFRAQAQHAFGVALHTSNMHAETTALQHLQLKVLHETGKHLEMTCSHLTLDEAVLPSVLVIKAEGIGISLMLYTPGDPSAALRQHASLNELEEQLAERLLNPDYQAFFKQLVPLQHQGSVLDVTPERLRHCDVPMQKKLAAQLKAAVSLTAIEGDLFKAIARQRIAQIKSDARIVAVPTADVDMLSRQKRLQDWIDLGKSALFFAASFIPVVGQALLVVTAVQVIHTVYEGFAAWSRGDSDEALNDLLDLVDTAALAVATAGAVRTVGFGARLVKVNVRGKGWRLWNADLKPYRHPEALPEHLVADKQGIYKDGQQHYLKLDDYAHAIQRTPDGQQWELSHPVEPQAYRPALLSNGVGGWRQAHETPHDWDELKLIKRLGPDAANITQPKVEPILLLSGLDKTGLREIHQDMQSPPPLLRDTVRDFNLDQELADFNLERAEGTSVTPCSPQIQFHLLTSLPEWPANHVLKIVGEQQQVVMSNGTGTVEIRISEARFRKGELLHALEEQMPQPEFNKLLPGFYVDYLTKIENLAARLADEVPGKKQRLLSLLNKPADTADTSTEKSLPPTLQMEARAYSEAAQAARLQAGIFLDARRSPESVPLVLYTLEQTPGWPKARKISVHDASSDGPLLGSIGGADSGTRHILVREGELYAEPPGTPTDLPGAIERTLTESERNTLFTHADVTSLEAALHKTGASLIARAAPVYRGNLLSRPAPTEPGLPLDPSFAQTSPPTGLTSRTDGLHHSRPASDGSYRYYVQDQQNYYEVRADTQGWRLVDARNRFRAYQPYVRQKTGGGWEIDQTTDALLGGRESPTPSVEGMESSDEFESMHSSSDYGSAEGDSVQPAYEQQELNSMRAERGYQYSSNYQRIYDRANNGRYPLRNLTGQPMRIRHLQAQGKSLTSDAVFASTLIRPYIQWEGYENVARLYEDKLEVTPFTASHQKFAQESALIGQATVITRKPLKKGEALGVYGGEILPLYVAQLRQDPYLMAIKEVRPTSPYSINTQPILSGDNVLSRINTIFEYEAGHPVRQASTGYNVEAAQFRVNTQVGNAPQEQMILTGMFAAENIPAGAELRWNYQYSEATIRQLFPLPPG